MMMSLTGNLMIRRGMIPRYEGVRLHFINIQASRPFSALAAPSNNRINSDLRRDAARTGYAERYASSVAVFMIFKLANGSPPIWRRL